MRCRLRPLCTVIKGICILQADYSVTARLQPLFSGWPVTEEHSPAAPLPASNGWSLPDGAEACFGNESAPSVSEKEALHERVVVAGSNCRSLIHPPIHVKGSVTRISEIVYHGAAFSHITIEPSIVRESPIAPRIIE